MFMDNKAFFMVEKGEPYRKGEAIPLVKNEVLLGRSWNDYHPDIAFDSLYLSRRHAIILNRDSRCELKIFPESKTVTKINGLVVEKGVAYQLKHGDRLNFANEEIILIFCAGLIPGDTITKPETAEKAPLVFDEPRHAILLDGKDLHLHGKAYLLFKCLYEQKGRAVSDDEIRKKVWPERETDATGIPLVGDEEITTLISSLKKRLGRCKKVIETIKGYGYRMDIEFY